MRRAVGDGAVRRRSPSTSSNAYDQAWGNSPCPGSTTAGLSVFIAIQLGIFAHFQPAAGEELGQARDDVTFEHLPRRGNDAEVVGIRGLLRASSPGGVQEKADHLGRGVGTSRVGVGAGSLTP